MARPRRVHRPPDYRPLLHALNQRYYRQWLRAEHLQAELARARWLGPLVGCLRFLKRRLFAASVSATPDCPPLTEGPPPTPARVSVIIPFRDQLDLLRGCLRSLRLTAHGDRELILVDNGSVETPTRRYLDRVHQHGRATVVSMPEPFNFSRLCNAGARHATGNYLLFLNNDVEALHADWLDRLLRAVNQPGVGVAGATLLYPDHTVQHAGLFPDATGRWVHVGRGLPVSDGVVRSVPAVTGACLLVSRRLFADLGGFDERLALTYNDVDFCCRARQRGLAVAVTPHARLLHYEGLTRGFAGDAPGADHLAALARFPAANR